MLCLKMKMSVIRVLGKLKLSKKTALTQSTRNIIEDTADSVANWSVDMDNVLMVNIFF